MSEEILKNIDASKSVNELREFLQIFSLSERLTNKIHQFIICDLRVFLVANYAGDSEPDSCNTSSSEVESDASTDPDSEYFDEEETEAQ